MALYCQGKSGLAQFRKAVAARPNDAWFHLNLALALHDQGQTAEGMRELAAALRHCPDCIAQAAQQAWSLATHPDRQRRDPGTALIRALQVYLAPGAHGPQDLDTLAVAYAAMGRFKAATATAQKALRQARAAKDTNLIGRIEQQLTLFQKRQPYVSKETLPIKPKAKRANNRQTGE
jgi:tetratricopeptide (TPR) repeat protein